MMCTVFGIRKKKIPQPSRREGTTHSPINRAVLSSSQSAVLHGRIYRVSPETAQNRRFPQRPPRAKVVFGYKRISRLGSTRVCRRVRWQTFSSSLNTIPGGGGVTRAFSSYNRVSKYRNFDSKPSGSDASGSCKVDAYGGDKAGKTKPFRDFRRTPSQ